MTWLGKPAAGISEGGGDLLSVFLVCVLAGKHLERIENSPGFINRLGHTRRSSLDRDIDGAGMGL